MRRFFLIVVFVVAAFAPAQPVIATGAAGITAAAAIRAAINQRVGEAAVVTVVAIDPATDAPVFREARPDPNARLGAAMRFTLIPTSGLPVIVTATVRVVAPHVVVRTPIERGHAVEAEAVDVVRGEILGASLARIPAPEDVLGVRTLRPLAKGDVVMQSSVAIKRAVEPGDSVTVVAIDGAVEVRATFVAADGGGIGDIIRVANPETRKYIRGRIVKAGLIEVIHDR